MPVTRTLPILTGWLPLPPRPGAFPVVLTQVRGGIDDAAVAATTLHELTKDL